MALLSDDIHRSGKYNLTAIFINYRSPPDYFYRKILPSIPKNDSMRL